MKTFFFETKPELEKTPINNYIFGYKKLADLSAELLFSNEGVHYDDTLRIPVLFLYRHYIELRLKNLYNQFVSCHPEATSINLDVLQCHDIQKIWENLLKLFDELLIEREDAISNLFEDINNVIEQFNRYDKHSQTFRYDIDKKGNEHRVLSFTIDYEMLSESIDEADDSFFALEQIILS